ncbi:hypothetical protein QZH41_001620 [Actinostola sp. cb2023]|nr:hypothetical protein QZH41_001620 [Actinostola sp. cb2023]
MCESVGIHKRIRLLTEKTGRPLTLDDLISLTTDESFWISVMEYVRCYIKEHFPAIKLLELFPHLMKQEYSILPERSEYDEINKTMKEYVYELYETCMDVSTMKEIMIEESNAKLRALYIQDTKLYLSTLAKELAFGWHDLEKVILNGNIPWKLKLEDAKKRCCYFKEEKVTVLKLPAVYFSFPPLYEYKIMETDPPDITTSPDNTTVTQGPPSLPELEVRIHQTSVTLTWSKPDENGGEIIKYTIHMKVIGMDGSLSKINVTATLFTYTVENLDPGKKYSFIVTAWNKDGESLQDDSKAKTVIIPVETTTTPPLLQLLFMYVLGYDYGQNLKRGTRNYTSLASVEGDNVTGTGMRINGDVGWEQWDKWVGMRISRDVKGGSR